MIYISSIGMSSVSGRNSMCVYCSWECICSAIPHRPRILEEFSLNSEYTGYSEEYLKFGLHENWLSCFCLHDKGSWELIWTRKLCSLVLKVQIHRGQNNSVLCWKWYPYVGVGVCGYINPVICHHHMYFPTPCQQQFLQCRAGVENALYGDLTAQSQWSYIL